MSAIGLYGKVPAQGDFVRVNVADPAALALVQWLEEGFEAMLRAGAQLPNEPAFFLFRALGARSVAVGAFGPSTDRVGRTFPMAVFALLEARAAAVRFPAVPLTYGGFLAQAAALIAEAPGLTAAQLAERVRALAGPTQSDVAAAEETCRRTLDGTAALEVSERLFGDAGSGRQYYAYRTFLDACATARGREPPKAAITLACPLASDVDLFAWLELARRVLQWTDAPPAFFWTEGAQPRLLLPLGPPPPAALLYLARPEHAAAKLWPLVTERADAIEAARHALSPVHRRAIDEPGSSLEALVATLSS